MKIMNESDREERINRFENQGFFSNPILRNPGDISEGEAFHLGMIILFDPLESIERKWRALNRIDLIQENGICDQNIPMNQKDQEIRDFLESYLEADSDFPYMIRMISFSFGEEKEERLNSYFRSF